MEKWFMFIALQKLREEIFKEEFAKEKEIFFVSLVNLFILFDFFWLQFVFYR